MSLSTDHQEVRRGYDNEVYSSLSMLRIKDRGLRMKKKKTKKNSISIQDLCNSVSLVFSGSEFPLPLVDGLKKRGSELLASITYPSTPV